MDDWITHYDREITQAEAARAAGNEGRARVCARRAAGAVISEYMRRQGLQPRGPSAYDRVRDLLDLPDISPEVRQAAGHFLLRVTPEFTLPEEIDLIDEARWLRRTLLGS